MILQSMRKWSVLFCCLLALAVLAGCQSEQTADPIAVVTEEGKLKIVTTIFPPYDFARQIAGSAADVKMLLRPGAESHSFEPTPQDIKDIMACDLFIYTGGENDVWVDDILNTMEEERPDTLKLLDCVPTVTEELVAGMEHGHAEESHAAETASVDEHVWTSPQNAVQIVQAITDLMVQKDPSHTQSYQQNCASYVEQLEALDAAFRQVVADSQRQTVLFGDRFPFRYLADAYGLQYYAAFSGCSSETEASAATIAFLIDKVEEEQLPVVFTMEFSNGKIADSISEATGAKRLTMYSCHNITKDQMTAGATYLSLMTENVESLRIALN